MHNAPAAPETLFLHILIKAVDRVAIITGIDDLAFRVIYAQLLRGRPGPKEWSFIGIPQTDVL